MPSLNHYMQVQLAGLPVSMVLFQSSYVTLCSVPLTETNSFCLAEANKAKNEHPDSLAVFIGADSNDWPTTK